MPDPNPDPDPQDPSRLLRAWLPHIALFALTAGVVAWLVVVIWPALSALLLAASLSALTYPVLFAPIDSACARLLPRWNAADRRYLSALAATIALGAMAVGVVVVVLGSLIGSIQGTLHALLGLAMHDAHARTWIVDLLIDRANQVSVLYPDLHLDLAAMRQFLEHMLEQTAVGPAFFGYLVSGTGGFLARSALTLVTLFYLYSEGPRLVEALMQWLPLTDEQRRGLRQRFAATATHLLTVTIARAVAHGLALTVLAWFIGGFHPVVVMVIATFIALLPVVGPAVILAAARQPAVVAGRPGTGLRAGRGQPGRHLADRTRVHALGPAPAQRRPVAGLPALPGRGRRHPGQRSARHHPGRGRGADVHLGARLPAHALRRRRGRPAPRGRAGGRCREAGTGIAPP